MGIPFTIGNLEGELCESLYWSYIKGLNSTPFNILGVDKYVYCEKLLGYTPSLGDFPYFRNMDDLRKVCAALDRDLSLHLGLTKPPLQLGDYMKIGKYSGELKCNSDYYWYGDYLAVFGQKPLASKNCFQHQRDILGSTGNSGCFPYCHTLEDLIKFCNALNTLVESAKEDGHGFKVGDWIEITQGRTNFAKEMDKFVRKQFQITSIIEVDPYDCIIKFNGDGDWQWRFSQKHFKKVDPPHFLEQVQKDPSYEFNPNYDESDDSNEMKKSALVTPILIKVCKI